MSELAETLANHQAVVAELERRLDGAADEEAAFELVREIERVKLAAEIEILEVQAEHARRSGRAELAAHIDGIVEQTRRTIEAATQPSRLPRGHPHRTRETRKEE